MGYIYYFDYWFWDLKTLFKLYTSEYQIELVLVFFFRLFFPLNYYKLYFLIIIIIKLMFSC